ncbi:DEAD/DEAH box helicase [Mycobacterium sp. PS03-16]|uniref:DEAD/DEAH box helicase n=1 Tax=Mycobacterium sp. PS03-16 TaxID=2559611 RepID=UPI001431192D|nr:helicase-related protein [Mycobacterium sp. PS03-16]
MLDGKLVVVAEADLRPHVLDDPKSRLIEGRLGSARQFALRVTARRYELENLTNELVSLGEARVDVKPHQVSVVHRVISAYPHRFLLCDEVGLGKTIEAAMILKELRARGSAARALVIAPPNLLRQWQYELKSKFNEAFSILNSDTVRYLQTVQSYEGNPFDAFDSVIVSSAWVTSEKWTKLATESPWDMVIVDEAHHARVRGRGQYRKENRLYKTVRALASPDAFSKRAALFLTATPMQLDSSELYSLVEVLDPALFPNEERFNAHRTAVPGLSRLVHDLTMHGYPVPGASSDEVVKRVSGWLQIDLEVASARLNDGRESVAELCEDLSGRHLLSQVLIRNRKKIVGGFMPRQAHRWQVDLTPEEVKALNAVEAYVREGYAKQARTKDVALGFVMVIFQELMASSIRALRTSLDRRRARIEAGLGVPASRRTTPATVAELGDRLDDDELTDNILDRLAVADSEEAAELKLLVAMLDSVPTDSKGDVFIAQLKELRRHEPNPKVLLFTEFRETQEYLRERLEDIGWDVFVFHGRLKPDAKDAAVERFRSSMNPSILLSTEAGGEGRNFQFCHLLVNYDLPWNPMRVEQRIGRIDRIGQQHTVQVFNLWVKGTVEERVLNVLEHRINIFEETIGGLDPILGDAERDLAHILRLGGEERDRALTQFENQLELRLKAARTAEEKLRDFIMETKSYSSAIASTVACQESPITPADQEVFVTRLLADVNTYLDEQEDGTFQITFNEPLLSDYPQHTKDSRRRTAAFRPDVQPDSEHVEYLALGHSVVDALVQRVTDSSYIGSASAFEIPAADGLTEGTGWLIVYELGVPGLKEFREVSAYFVRDDGECDPALGEQLLHRAARFPKDVALAPSEVPSEGVDAALEVSEAAAYARLHQIEGRAHEDTRRRIAREREKLAAYFDYRGEAARDRLASSRAVLAEVEQSDQPEVRRIIAVWRANVARDERLIAELQSERDKQFAELANQAQASGDLSLIAVARIEIVGDE